MKTDPTYKEDFAFAQLDFVESLEAEALRRARDGVERPVFYKGVLCGYVREYSDTLLIFLLKALLPLKYRKSRGSHYAVPPVVPTYDAEAIRKELEDPAFLKWKAERLKNKTDSAV